MSRARSAAGARAGAALLAAALLSWPALGNDVDPFYQGLLEEGIRSHRRGDHSRASEELRIAAFGLLERPAELARALTHLALAQSAIGDLEGFERCYRRLTELESRFRAFSDAAVEADLRSALEQAARTHLGDAALESEPRLATPAPADPTLAEAAPVEAAPARALPVAVAASSRPRLCVSWTGDGECRQPAAAPARPTATPEELAALDRLDRLAAGKATDKKLQSGFEQARELADRYPDLAAAQRVAAVLAARSGSFADAVRYYDRAGDPAQEQPIELFYLSVALFETNRPDAAANILRRALPALKQNREVRRYVRRILNEESAG